MRLKRFASSRHRYERDGDAENEKRGREHCAYALLVIECDSPSRLPVRCKSGNPPSNAHVGFMSFLNDVVERRLIGRCVVLSHRDTCACLRISDKRMELFSRICIDNKVARCLYNRPVQSPASSCETPFTLFHSPRTIFAVAVTGFIDQKLEIKDGDE